MKTKLLLFALLLIGVSAGARVTTGSAPVLSSAGRFSCKYVQLWEGGPKWATFNVGATIMDYANLIVGADVMPCSDYPDLAPYYNTANVGGLYAWNNPSLNGRQTTWSHSVATGLSDVATTLWGSNWKTPTYEQLDTLCNHSNCSHSNARSLTTWTWCDGSSTQYVDGCTLKGFKVSGVGEYADKSIFLPATGIYHYDWSVVSSVSHDARYWSVTRHNVWVNALDYYDGSTAMITWNDPEFGLSVRAVLDESVPVSTTYTVTFVNYDGTILQMNGVEEGETPIYTGIVPTKPVDADSVYFFGGWNKEIVAATDDATYIAIFLAHAKHSPAPTGVEMVDLGLPSGTLWANMNIGANSPEEYGNYYAWGETTVKTYYDWSTYKYCNGLYDSMTKYCSESRYGYNGYTDNKTTLELEDDAASVNWGNGWRMPTEAEWSELLTNCTWTWTQVNGVNGCTISASNGNSIFLPAAGARLDMNLYSANSVGVYWAASHHPFDSDDARIAYFSGDKYWIQTYSRANGLPVRPVYSRTPSRLEIPITAGQWHYIAFPVEVTSDKIEYAGNGTWGYYDSNRRATGVSGWQSVDPETTPLNANQGYIFYGDQDGTLYVNIDPATLPTESKSIVLTDYPSFHPDNENWNFVGNPYYATYDVVNVAPNGMNLYVWNGMGYYAKTAGHDNYDLQPLEAFFVQKKSTENSVDFAAASAGAAAPARAWAANSNRYIDIAAVAGGYTDYTRVVLNETASVDYTVGYDLAKFFSNEAPIQLFSLDAQSIECGVQELPNGVEEIALGYTVLVSGEVVVSATDMEETYYLYDAETGITTDLRQSSYTFTAEAGTTVNRLSLRRAPGTATGVEYVDGVNKYVNTITKVVREGHVLILRGEKMFDLRGQEVK